MREKRPLTRARRTSPTRTEALSLGGAFLGALALGSIGCISVPPPPKTTGPPMRPVVERVEGGRVEIRWPAGLAKAAPLRVYGGPTPDAIDRSEALALSTAGDRALFLPTPPRGRHPFYALVPSDGSTGWVVAERRVPLDGPDNFRDLGGYRTRAGGTVRWHRLYRSDDLAELTGRDIDLLDTLGLRGIHDLRSKAERSSHPNQPVAGASLLEVGIPVVGIDPVDLRHRIRTGGLDPVVVEQAMTEAYRSFVTDHADQWAAILRQLVEPENLPIVVHCTAGKDRTGFASALVLLLLGVPERTVFEDYLATNRYQASTRRWLERLVPIYSLFRTDAADLAPLLDARRSYLEASLDEIEEGWGSVERYAEQRLGFSSADQDRLRSLFVQ